MQTVMQFEFEEYRYKSEPQVMCLKQIRFTPQGIDARICAKETMQWSNWCEVREISAPVLERVVRRQLEEQNAVAVEISDEDFNQPRNDFKRWPEAV